MSSSDLTPEEILRHRALLHELLAADLPRPTFVKVHDAFLRTAEGAPLFPPAVTLGAVYVVRNPLDVAVSYARFWNWPLARGVAELNRRDAVLSSPAAGIYDVLPERLSTWSGHAASRAEQREFPVHAVRYEDLLANPETAFGAVLRFAGIEPDAWRGRSGTPAWTASAPRRSARGSTRSRGPRASSSGRAERGGWRETLSREQVRTLTEAHAPLMERFGYLSEAEAFLAERQ